MKRFYSNVCSAQRSLQERPEVFHAVDVNLPAHIALRLIDKVVNKPTLQSVVVAYGVIRIDRTTKLHVLENLVLQSLTSHVWNHGSADLAQVAVKDALHNRLACGRSHESIFSG